MITSTANGQVKELVRLKNKSRAREEAGVFLVEGPRMAREIPEEWIEGLYLSESYQKKGGWTPKKGIRTEILSDTVFAYVSDTKTPQGILAVVKRVSYGMEEVCRVVGGRKPLLLVLDNLQDPGNLGTIFRTAEAAGVTGIVLGNDCVDIYNPKVIRSTMGAVFRVPFLYTEDIVGTLEELRLRGVRLFAAHLKGENDYDRESYQGGSAFLIGNEGNGLRDEVTACADCLVKIPMEGKAESLNAAVAASLLVFEAARQRRG